MEDSDLEYLYTCIIGGQKHLIKRPIILPCGKSVCLECIKKKIDHFKVFACFYCDDWHIFNDFTRFSLRTDFNLINNIKKNLLPIADDLCDRLDNTNKQMRDKLEFNNQNRALDNLFEFIKENLFIRIESINIELDNLQIKLMKNINIAKNKCSKELSDLKQIQKIDKIELDLKDKTLNKYLYKKIKKLNKSSKIIENLSFELLSYQPKYHPNVIYFNDKYKLIGIINSPFNLFKNNTIDKEYLDKNNAQLFDLSKFVTSAGGLCQMNKNYEILVIDNFLNKIIVYDKYFNYSKDVNLNEMYSVREANLAFNSNFFCIQSVSTFYINKENYDYAVFINNMENNELIILDQSMENIKKIISPPIRSTNSLSNNSRKTLFEFEIYKDNLSRRLLKYTITGNLINSIELQKRDMNEFLNDKKVIYFAENNLIIEVPSSFTINKYLIACIFPIMHEIHLFQLNDGKLCNILKLDKNENKISCSFLNDDYLCVYHRSKALIQFYLIEKNQNNLSNFNIKLIYEKYYPELINNANSKFSYMFNQRSIMPISNNQIAILFGESNLVALIRF